MTTAPNMTLYGIETQLLELLNFRESVSEDPDMTPAEQKDSLEAIDRQIAEYIRAEVKKCDGIARYLREFETRAEALKAEAKRCSEMAKAWEKRHEALENMVVDVMQATKQTRIDGRHSVLQLKKNPPSVEVAQPELLPHELLRTTVKIPFALWRKVLDELHGKAIAAEVYDKAQWKDGEPMKTEIAKRLKEGDGVPGCRLRTDGVRLEVK